MSGEMRRAALITTSVIFILSFSIVSAQSQIYVSGSLRYIRQNATAFEYVTLAGSNQFVYAPPPTNCSVNSPNGEYLAQSLNLGTSLVVQDFVTQQIVFQTDWSPLWKPCGFYFSSETILIIPEAIGSQYYLLNVETGQNSDPMIPPPHVPDYSFLLDLAWEQWVLPAPDGQRYFYARCTNGSTTLHESHPYGFVSCSTQMDWVIYDERQPPFILDQTSTESLVADLALEGASWSPNSRYLAYLAYYGLDQLAFPLRVFDLQTSSTLPEPSFGSVDIDNRMGIHWSPDGSKIAVWVSGRIGDPEPQDQNLEYLHQLVLLDMVQNEYRIADKPYEDGGSRSGIGYWSPDSQGYAFQDNHANLIYVDATTGASSILDTNLAYIVTWSPTIVSTD